VTLDDRDREVLKFLAAQRLALRDHLTVVLGNRDLTRQRIGRLVAADLVRRERVMCSEPDYFQITRAGLDSIGSELPPPDFDPRYRHDVGAAWMWLAARGGAWGPAERIMTKREMRSRDQRRSQGSRGASFGEVSLEHQAQTAPLLGIRVTSDSKSRLHYPDLLLVRGRRRVAIELQLAAPSPRRLSQVLSCYGADQRIGTILFAVVDPIVAKLVRSAAANVQRPPVIHVQLARFDDVTPYPVRPNP
jgi:hypothetical protein